MGFIMVQPIAVAREPPTINCSGITPYRAEKLN